MTHRDISRQKKTCQRTAGKKSSGTAEWVRELSSGFENSKFLGDRVARRRCSARGMVVDAGWWGREGGTLPLEWALLKGAWWAVMT
jgi:hypothetical protein